MNAAQILDREFLEIRAKILEVAASLDRLDRAAGNVSDDRRLDLIAKAIGIVSGQSDDRATQIQLLFSREYEPEWQQQFGLAPTVDAS